jgi:3-oxoacyl-[acyl-carrier protein] reductase
MHDFTGKIVLVTGGTRGIGRACAEHFARAGARVALCGRDAAAAEAVASEIGGDCRGYGADMASAESVNALVASVERDLGPVEILVNNAGITQDGLLMRMKDAQWSAVLETNLNGAFYATRAVARGMLKQRRGRVVNISSVVGLRGQGGQTNYAAAKAGIIGFSKAYAQEVASRSITVNVVAPGYITTDMTAGFDEQQVATILGHIPLQRAGTPDDVAHAVLFLASDAAAYITGAVLPVDGGLAM